MNSTKNIIGVIILLSGFSFFATAQSDQDRIIDQIIDFHSVLTSIECTYKQEQAFDFLDEKLFSSGEFSYVKPSSMKWEQILPDPYFFVLTPESTYAVKDGKKNKIPSASPQIAGLKKFMTRIMDGSILKDENYEADIKIEKGKLSVELLPKSKMERKMFSKIILQFDVESSLLMDLAFFESEESVRWMHFDGHQINSLVEIPHFTD